MTYIIEIKETSESKPLLAHLRTLKYVRMKKAGKKTDVAELVKTIRKSEKSRKLKWSDAKKQIASWK